MAVMGRPPLLTEEKIKLLKDICRFKPTLEDCSGILDVHEDTIAKWIRANHNCTFSEFRDKRMAVVRNNVVRALIDSAIKKGNVTAQIYLTKTMCGWRENEPVAEVKLPEVKVNLKKLTDKELETFKKLMAKVQPEEQEDHA